MNPKYPSIIFAFGLLLFLTACNKNDNAISAASIVGKWYVSKITIHQTSMSGGITFIADTTYSGNVFNSHDFFQFNSDHTASLSASGDFEVSGKATITDGAGNPIYGTNSFTYSLSGHLLTLTSTLLLPLPAGASGRSVNTIIHLDSNTLVLRGGYSAGTFTTTSDTYYTKGN